MKKHILFLFVLTISFNSCKKMKEAGDTIANITLYDRNNDLLSGWKVYAFTDEHLRLYGSDRTFADKTVVTDSNGVAKFILNDIQGLFSNGTRQETLHFYVYYTIGTGSTVYTCHVSITFEEGDTKSGTITLN